MAAEKIVVIVVDLMVARPADRWTPAARLEALPYSKLCIYTERTRSRYLTHIVLNAWFGGAEVPVSPVSRIASVHRFRQDILTRGTHLSRAHFQRQQCTAIGTLAGISLGVPRFIFFSFPGLILVQAGKEHGVG